MKDEEFLHQIDIDALKRETGLEISELAAIAGISENSVYKWGWTKKRNGTRPNYNALVSMLQKGATTLTLFGVETNGVNPPKAGANGITVAELARFFAEAAEKMDDKA